jgi:hypothetical protein
MCYLYFSVVELGWAATYSAVTISSFSHWWSLDRSAPANGVKAEAIVVGQRQDRGNQGSSWASHEKTKGHRGFT